ncbi:Uncharacterized protein TCM_027707 [Theobroma cacao]|uniref:Reverse transcriptase zinc-binding domain-containing protein n=1 Tax=Theobroma cacao TaxID=3641 RepID=A0A061GGT2_THECC|nr:Uncharacterized protein TCM_027707 [Theobroma cacao]
MIGKGASIYFWMDKWRLANEPLSAKYLRLFSLVVDNDAQDNDAYNEILLELSNAVLVPRKENRLLWKHHPKGHFSVKIFCSLLDADLMDHDSALFSDLPFLIPSPLNIFLHLAEFILMRSKDFVVGSSLRVSWQPPNGGDLKFIVDSLARGKPDLTSCGGILRNLEGYVVGVFFDPLVYLNSNFVELIAIFYALRLFALSPYIGFNVCNTP